MFGGSTPCHFTQDPFYIFVISYSTSEPAHLWVLFISIFQNLLASSSSSSSSAAAAAAAVSAAAATAAANSL